LSNNDVLINDVLENSDLDFDLWDIENLQPPAEATVPEVQPQPWAAPEAPKAEIKAETPLPAISQTKLVVSPVPVAALPFQPQPVPQVIFCETAGFS
jgi:hypothetical protein